MNRLIVTQTHGDEGFAVPVVNRLAGKFKFDRLTGNPKAAKINRRYVESDLNRYGPGNFKSIFYEERRARKVINMASQYQEIIDIHGTVSNCGLFSLVSDPSWRNIELAKKINLRRIVLWPSLRPNGPLTQFIPNSIEIECGPKDKQEVSEQLEQVLSDYLRGIVPTYAHTFYVVTGRLEGQIAQPMRDFQLTSYQGKQFYPLLVDQYPGIKCYCLQKMKDTLSFNKSLRNF